MGRAWQAVFLFAGRAAKVPPMVDHPKKSGIWYKPNRPPIRRRRNSNEPTKEERMKGNEKVIEQLNARLAEELAAINQYFLHAEMCENWRYESLKGEIKKRSIAEMRHAEKLIERILFLEGKPVVSKLGKIGIGDNVEKIHQNDWAAENDAIQKYNESIRIAVEVGDNGTKELLESILKDEEAHIDWIEAQQDQIKQMGIQVYLGEQIA
jgi:bacterioferritin